MRPAQAIQEALDTQRFRDMRRMIDDGPTYLDDRERVRDVLEAVVLPKPRTFNYTRCPYDHELEKLYWARYGLKESISKYHAKEAEARRNAQAIHDRYAVEIDGDVHEQWRFVPRAQ